MVQLGVRSDHRVKRYGRFIATPRPVNFSSNFVTRQNSARWATARSLGQCLSTLEELSNGSTRGPIGSPCQTLWPFHCNPMIGQFFIVFCNPTKWSTLGDSLSQCLSTLEELSNGPTRGPIGLPCQTLWPIHCNPTSGQFLIEFCNPKKGSTLGDGHEA